jgi:hypothetical protein
MKKSDKWDEMEAVMQAGGTKSQLPVKAGK